MIGPISFRPRITYLFPDFLFRTTQHRVTVLVREKQILIL
jgi:hypothetical protein